MIIHNYSITRDYPSIVSKINSNNRLFYLIDLIFPLIINSNLIKIFKDG